MPAPRDCLMPASSLRFESSNGGHSCGEARTSVLRTWRTSRLRRRTLWHADRGLEATVDVRPAGIYSSIPPCCYVEFALWHWHRDPRVCPCSKYEKDTRTTRTHERCACTVHSEMRMMRTTGAVTGPKDHSTDNTLGLGAHTGTRVSRHPCARTRPS